jgi:hypothetical protein
MPNFAAWHCDCFGGVSHLIFEQPREWILGVQLMQPLYGTHYSNVCRVKNEK